MCVVRMLLDDYITRNQHNHNHASTLLQVAGKKEEKTEAQKNEEMNYGDLNAGGDSDEDA